MSNPVQPKTHFINYNFVGHVFKIVQLLVQIFYFLGAEIQPIGLHLSCGVIDQIQQMNFFGGNLNIKSIFSQSKNNFSMIFSLLLVLVVGLKIIIEEKFLSLLRAYCRFNVPGIRFSNPKELG